MNWDLVRDTLSSCIVDRRQLPFHYTYANERSSAGLAEATAVAPPAAAARRHGLPPGCISMKDHISYNK
jgi:hypothetical protein